MTEQTTKLGEVAKVTSALAPEKARELLKLFEGFFTMIEIWQGKAHAIKVDDRSQVGDMKMARTARLFLVSERKKIEDIRKELKQPNVAEGKAIDGIANILKMMIQPVEKYLLTQENFAKELDRIEADRVQRIADDKAKKELKDKEKAEADERERLAKIESERISDLEAENKRLKAEKLKIDQQPGGRLWVGNTETGWPISEEEYAKLPEDLKSPPAVQKNTSDDAGFASVPGYTGEPLPARHDQTDVEMKEVKSVKLVCPHCKESFWYGEVKADDEDKAPF